MVSTAVFWNVHKCLTKKRDFSFFKGMMYSFGKQLPEVNPLLTEVLEEMSLEDK